MPPWRELCSPSRPGNPAGPARRAPHRGRDARALQPRHRQRLQAALALAHALRAHDLHGDLPPPGARRPGRLCGLRGGAGLAPRRCRLVPARRRERSPRLVLVISS